jgi:hypothetical protein
MSTVFDIYRDALIMHTWTQTLIGDATMSNPVRDHAARCAADHGSHGYHGEHVGAELLRLCASAVRIGARRVEHAYSLPMVSADERAEYTNELAARLIAEHGGIPAAEDVGAGYLSKRAAGLILNDRSRRDLDLDQPSAAEAGSDPRLDGPLSIPAAVGQVAERLGLGETATKALAAAMVPATRAEWARHYGYRSADVWRQMAKRGRAQLVAIGEDAIRDALAQVEAERLDALDAIDTEARELAREIEKETHND